MKKNNHFFDNWTDLFLHTPLGTSSQLPPYIEALMDYPIPTHGPNNMQVCNIPRYSPENTYLLCKRKYHCIAGLQFDCIGSCYFVRTQTVVQLYSDTFP